MSWVDNYVLLLSWGFGSDEAVADLNTRLSKIGVGHEFRRADRYAGGNKHMERSVFLLAGNFLSLEQVARAMAKKKAEERWRMLEAVEEAGGGAAAAAGSATAAAVTGSD